MSNPFEGINPPDVERMIGELWLPDKAEKRISPDGREMFIIRSEFNPDDVHDAVWSPFDDAGELRTEELVAEGWRIVGAIREGDDD